MLSKERIKEAERNVISYLEDGLLKEVAVDQKVLNVILQNAKESIKVAEEINQQNLSDLWVIVCSYYAMFYCANAVLLKFGYKVGEKIVHKVTADAIIIYVRGKLKETFIEEYENMKEEALNLAGIKTDNLIESLDFERKKRSIIQLEYRKRLMPAHLEMRALALELLAQSKDVMFSSLL